MAKVLVIDDDGAIVRLILKVLSGRGHLVMVARDGKSGLARVAAERPDLVIVDSDLPKIDGAEVCRSIKEDASTATIPVIMMTPHYVDFYGREATAEPNAVVVRPFTREVLANAVERALGGLGPRRPQRRSQLPF
ncbi:MAG: response regulator [Kofleriaceae bacterium]|nr:response regulator [Kofleriaceae bacterium]